MANSKQQIEKLEEIEKSVGKSRGRVTYSDVSQATGFSLVEVEDLMPTMMERYRCRLGMNQETGDVVLNFAYPLRRRDKKTFKEQMVKAGDATLKVLKVVYRASIGIVMIAYAIIFVVLIIGASFAGGRSGNSDDDNDSGISFSPMLFSMLADIFRSIFFYQAITGDDYYGYSGRNERPRSGKGKRALEAIYKFVFGPEKKKYNPLDDSREAIAFIRMNHGKISAGNIAALTGLTLDAAEDKLAEYTGKFHGEPEITDNGTVVCSFRQLMVSVENGSESARILYYKNEPEEGVEFTGNSSGANLAVVAVNAFNLLMSYQLMNVNGVPAWLGIFPFVVSILYYIIPILRLPGYSKAKKRRLKSLYRKALVGLITDYPGHNFTEEEFENALKLLPKEDAEVISDGILKSVIREVIRNYGGVANINAAGQAVYKFEKLENQLNYQH